MEGVGHVEDTVWGMGGGGWDGDRQGGGGGDQWWRLGSRGWWGERGAAAEPICPPPPTCGPLAAAGIGGEAAAAAGAGRSRGRGGGWVAGGVGTGRPPHSPLVDGGTVSTSAVAAAGTRCGHLSSTPVSAATAPRRWGLVGDRANFGYAWVATADATARASGCCRQWRWMWW